MIKFISLFISFNIALLLSAIATEIDAKQRYNIQQCRILTTEPIPHIDTAFTESLFWKIQRRGYKTSYLLGTIHVKDSRVLALPKPIIRALNASDHFIMESINTPEEDLQLGQQMFSAGENSLFNSFDDSLTNKTIDILSLYHIPIELVGLIQPWAAYITMNYPPGNGIFLDLKLLDLATQRNITTSGLETLDEQLSIFTKLTSAEQYQLLLDSVCNYEQIQNDLKTMIELYLNNDLAGLIRYSNRYGIDDEDLYQRLTEELISDRNTRMADRIIPYLKRQANFIAIGALHLSGNDGVLSQLKKSGFTITPIEY